jgi:hypothetical protein
MRKVTTTPKRPTKIWSCFRRSLRLDALQLRESRSVSEANPIILVPVTAAFVLSPAIMVAIHSNQAKKECYIFACILVRQAYVFDLAFALPNTTQRNVVQEWANMRKNMKQEAASHLKLKTISARPSIWSPQPFRKLSSAGRSESALHAALYDRAAFGRYSRASNTAAAGGGCLTPA